MGQHTPGPWKVDESEHRAMGGERVYKVIGDKKYGGLIADVSAWWVDTESAEHNAHLIAAAPAMLEALQAARSYIETPGDLTPEEVGYLLEDIEMAIASATGHKCEQ